MISDEARREIETMFAGKGPADQRPLAQRRRDWEQWTLQDVLPKGARFSATVAGGVACEWMDMPHVSQDRIFLFMHGGGFNAGSPKTHRKLAANIARTTNMRVLVPDYRLAPEHPFPAGVKDGLMVFGWLLSQGRKESDIIVGGDSAGGGLALSMLLALREAGAPMPRAAVLLSPWADLTLSSPSYERLRSRDPSLSVDELREAAAWYTGRRRPDDPMLSPVFADLGGLPPLLIHAGSDEIMLDDSKIIAEKATTAGVEVTAKIWPGLWHVFHSATPHVPEANQGIAEIGEFVRRQFGG